MQKSVSDCASNQHYIISISNNHQANGLYISWKTLLFEMLSCKPVLTNTYMSMIRS